MKTIEQVLENVTAGGRWKADGSVLRAGHQNRDRVADFMHGLGPDDHQVNAAYAALSASSFPALVKALSDLAHRHVELIDSGDCGQWDSLEDPAVTAARAALQNALKD